MSKGLILVTVVDGYIASVTAKHFLEAGHSVRGTVRKLGSAEPLFDALKEYVEAGKLTVVEVPDMTADGAFDEAVKEVTAIAHLASPVSFFFTDPIPVLHAAINGTVGLLTSALTAGPQLKTVVIMSSIASVKNANLPPYVLTEKDWNDVAEAEVERLGKDTPGLVIYSASKVAAEKAFWSFRDEKKPSFTMTAINPVAAGNPQAIADILRKEFAEVHNRIVEGTPGEGYKKGFEADEKLTTPVDSSKGRKLIGDWVSFGKSVVDTAQQFAHLV